MPRFSSAVLIGDFLRAGRSRRQIHDPHCRRRRQRPSGAGRRSRRGDAALCRPHGVPGYGGARSNSSPARPRICAKPMAPSSPASARRCVTSPAASAGLSRVHRTDRIGGPPAHGHAWPDRRGPQPRLRPRRHRPMIGLEALTFLTPLALRAFAAAGHLVAAALHPAPPADGALSAAPPVARPHHSRGAARQDAVVADAAAPGARGAGHPRRIASALRAGPCRRRQPPAAAARHRR